jgi:hypothetical protein
MKLLSNITLNFRRRRILFNGAVALAEREAAAVLAAGGTKEQSRSMTRLRRETRATPCWPTK